MAEWFSSTLGFLERIPKIAFQVSIPLIAIGACLRLAFDFGFVRKEALNGYAIDVAPILLAVGIAILIVGVLTAAREQVAKLPKWLAEREARKKSAGRLLENIRFLPDGALIVLLDILQQPSGRFPSPGGVQTMLLLEKLDLIASESEYDTVRSAGTMHQAAPVLLADRAEVMGYIRLILTQRGKISFDPSDGRRVSLEAASTIKADGFPSY
jgi:hypothetical protein